MPPGERRRSQQQHGQTVSLAGCCSTCVEQGRPGPARGGRGRHGWMGYHGRREPARWRCSDAGEGERDAWSTVVCPLPWVSVVGTQTSQAVPWTGYPGQSCKGLLQDRFMAGRREAGGSVPCRAKGSGMSRHDAARQDEIWRCGREPGCRSATMIACRRVDHTGSARRMGADAIERAHRP